MSTVPAEDEADAPRTAARLFEGYLLGGFECSIHRLRSGRRLDLIASTSHDRFAAADYRRLKQVGMDAARDGVRWTRIEAEPGTFDFASARPMIRAALEQDVRVIWDLLHFGWPDHVDPFDDSFPARFEDFVGRFAEVLKEEGDRAPAVCPVNEISFLSFAGGHAGFFNPFAKDRGDDLKRQLVRAAIVACRALRAALPEVRLVHTDPIIHVMAHPGRPEDREAAANHGEAQFHAWEMIAGRRHPELGGREEYLDVLGLNYYVHNQWYYPGGHGSMIGPTSEHSRPLHELLLDVHRRFGRPMFIAETGIEDTARPAWLAYVGHETREAIRRGAEVQGVCLYPIVDHPGWEDDRHCHNGLWGYADELGRRDVYAPLADEIERQQDRFETMEPRADQAEDTTVLLTSLEEIARSIAEKTETSREG